MLDYMIDRLIRQWDVQHDDKKAIGKRMLRAMEKREHKHITDARHHRRDEILKVAKEACRRLGGSANIDERYVVVDTDHFNVTPKESKND